MNNILFQKLQSELKPPQQRASYDDEHSRYTVRNHHGNRMLIHNAAFIFTCDKNDKVQVLKNHSILIDSDTIADVVPAADVNPANFDTVYDAGKRGGTVITPGFINTHAHPPMYLMRSAMMLDEGEGIDEAIAAMPRWERAMQDTDLTVSTVGDITEQQKYGITTVLSHYAVFNPVEYAARLTAHNIINAFSPVSNTHPENSPEMLTALAEQQRDCVSQVAASIHYLYKADEATLKKMVAIIRKYNLLFTLHMAESPMVVESCQKTFGKREVDVLEQFDLLNERTVASHVIYVTDDEVQRLIQTKVGLSHLPTSNVIHKSGTFPFWKFYDAGGLARVGLGTDSVVSKSRLDLLTEAYQTRIIHLYQRTVKFSSLFKMMTVNGARVLHLPDRGRIAKGHKADINFWKLKDRGCIPYDEHDPMTLLGNIITHGGRTVRDLMINGQWIIKDRIHQLVNESKMLELLQASHMEMRRRVAEK